MAEGSSVAKRQTLFNTSIGFVLKLIFSLVIALLFSITIEIIGMNFWWEDEGVYHSQKMYEYELSQIGSGQYGFNLEDEQLRFIHKTLVTHNKVIDVLNLKGVVDWAKRPVNDEGNPMRIIIKTIFSKVEEYIEASFNVAKVFSLRLAILTLSLPLFIFAMLVGVVDGLVERDLRRWGGGRESSTMFNLARATVVPLAVGSWVFYLSMPVSINPSFIIIPFVFMFGYSVRLTTDRMKKYF